jgi:sortase A
VFKEGNSRPKVGLMMALALVLAAAVVGSATLRSKPERVVPAEVAPKSVGEAPRYFPGEEGSATKKPSSEKDSPRYPSGEESLEYGSSSSGEPVEQRKEEAKGTDGERHYELLPGAITGLTIDADRRLWLGPVFDSDGRWALANGVAHNPQTSLPWSQSAQRNVYLAGHRMGFRGTWSRMIFCNLDKLEKGDEALLKDWAVRSYRYRVSEVFITDPKDVWVMGQVRGRDMPTLHTCTPIPTFQKRLIVRADRV